MLIGIVTIALGIGLKFIPILNSFNLIRIISSYLIFSITQFLSKNALYILADIIYKILEYWYLVVIGIVITLLILMKKKEENQNGNFNS